MSTMILLLHVCRHLWQHKHLVMFKSIIGRNEMERPRRDYFLVVRLPDLVAYTVSPHMTGISER